MKAHVRRSSMLVIATALNAEYDLEFVKNYEKNNWVSSKYVN